MVSKNKRQLFLAQLEMGYGINYKGERKNFFIQRIRRYLLKLLLKLFSLTQ